MSEIPSKPFVAAEGADIASETCIDQQPTRGEWVPACFRSRLPGRAAFVKSVVPIILRGIPWQCITAFRDRVSWNASHDIPMIPGSMAGHELHICSAERIDPCGCIAGAAESNFRIFLEPKVCWAVMGCKLSKLPFLFQVVADLKPLGKTRNLGPVNPLGIDSCQRCRYDRIDSHFLVSLLRGFP